MISVAAIALLNIVAAMQESGPDLTVLPNAPVTHLRSAAGAGGRISPLSDESSSDDPVAIARRALEKAVGAAEWAVVSNCPGPPAGGGEAPFAFSYQNPFLDGAFGWARRALTRRKRRFPAACRADKTKRTGLRHVTLRQRVGGLDCSNCIAVCSVVT
jgi:hypothetical protein